jgi:release factor glutamine methyltransferase
MFEHEVIVLGLMQGRKRKIKKRIFWFTLCCMLKSELVKYLVQELSSVYDADESSAITKQLLDHYLKQQAPVASGISPISEQTMAEVKAALHRLQEFEPLQYVLEEAWFYGLPFYVNNRVLIPRPETEELVHLILSDIGTETATRKLSGMEPPLRILDIGTGSGCIPIALKKNIRDAEVYGMDISADALLVAKRNAAQNDVDVDFREGDILDPTVKIPVRFKIIVSNPPYITHTEKEHMHVNVLAHEPHLALFVSNNDPLQFYKAIAAFAAQNLVTGGKLYVEINPQYGSEVKACFSGYGFAEVNSIRDMQGKDRIVSALWP